MENLVLFVLSVLVYTAIYFFVREIFTPWDHKKATVLKTIGIIALLCLPININGNVFTVAGNAVAEKNNFSILSFYKRAGEGDAVNVFGLGNIQISSKGSVMTIFGLPFYQKAKKDAILVCGLSFYQKGNKVATLMGVAVYQESKYESALGVGFAGYQNSEAGAVIWIGISGYQKARREAVSMLALTLSQKVSDRSRSFVAFSSLIAPESVPKPEQKNK